MMANIGPAHEDGSELLLEETGFRMSWGAIFAGFVVATMLQITLSLLGVAIGFAGWEGGGGLGGVATNAGLWALFSALVALFVGGLTTGRLAGVLTRGDGAIHGVVMWGLTMLVGLWLIASGASALVGGAFSLVESTVSAAAGGLARGVGELGGAVVQGVGNLDPAAAQDEIELLLEQTGVPELQPGALAADAQGVGGVAATGATNEQVAAEIARLAETRAGALDREAVINVLVARTGMARADAERAADRVVAGFGDLRQGVAAGVDEVRAGARDAAGAAADAVANAAWWALLILGLTVAVAAWGASSTATE